MNLRCLLMASCAALMPVSVFAQTAANTAVVEEEIVITGSRIVTRDLRSTSPVTTTSSEELKLQGVVNIEEALVEIPQAVPGISSSNNNGSNGTTTVNLRGLGDVRTLVLVDGKRWTPAGNTGVVDLNTIPVMLIKRVEVVTGGASAVYGSDALAGVVNFILDDKFEGLQANATSSVTEQGDGFTIDANLVAGGSFAGGRGHATIWGGYTKRDPVFQGDRPFSRFALAANRTDDGLIESGSTTAFPANIVLSAPANRGIDTDGDGVVSFGPNGTLNAQQSIFNTNPINFLQVPQERYTAGAMFTYELAPSIEAFGRITFANNRVSTQLAPSGTFFASFFINPDNPFLAPGTVAALQAEAGPGGTDANGNVRTSIGYRFASPRRSDFSRTAYQVQGGLRGDLGTWRWEAYGQYSRTEQQTSLTGDGDLTRIAQALQVRNVNGTPQCINAANGCVPLNIFTNDPSLVTPEALAFISLDLQVQATTEQTVFGGSFAGDLGEGFKSPLADSPIGIAVGVEYRAEDSVFRPDANYAAGRSAGFGSQAVVIGGFNVKELFGEIRIPLIEDRPFFQSLSLEGGARVSDYSTSAGTVYTYKAGGDWSPVRGLRFRGLYQRAVRAPNINELFQPQVETSVTGSDPCAGPTPAAGRAICEAVGVPAGRYGTVPLPPAGQFQGFAGGNPDLTVETSDTYTFGVVLNPTFIPNLTITADYYSVSIADTIEPLAGGGQNALNACYLQLRDPNSVFCRQIVRDPVNGSLFGGNETGVYATLVNTGRTRTTGYDLAISYQVGLGNAGRLRLNANATIVDSFSRQGGVGLPVFECAGKYGAICNQIIPDLKTAARLSWDKGPVTTSVRWRHLGSTELDRIAFGTDTNGRAPVPTLPARNYFDLDAAIQVNEGLSFNAGIANVLDEKPPVFGLDVGGFGASANTYPGTFDALGRSYRIAATVRF